MYFGTNLVKLDAKGRAAIPARHRERLHVTSGSRVAVTVHPLGESCLWMYPQNEWERVAETVANLPPLNQQNAMLQHVLFSNLYELELDGQGRILLPTPLREHADLLNGEQIAIVGMGKRFEIWSEAAMQAQNSACAEAARQPGSELSADLQNLML
jgi:MraZ protein